MREQVPVVTEIRLETLCFAPLEDRRPRESRRLTLSLSKLQDGSAGSQYRRVVAPRNASYTRG